MNKKITSLLLSQSLLIIDMKIILNESLEIINDLKENMRTKSFYDELILSINSSLLLLDG
jgi:hypothetical protein